MSLAAIILAGGRATRLGGTAKTLLEVGGVPLLQGTIDAADAAGCLPIVAVGPVVPGDPRVWWVREDPPFGGPVSAIAAALPLVDTTEVLVLATDLPRASEAVSFLLEAAAVASYGDGLCLADESGRPQWLSGLYRTSALRRAADDLPDGGAGASVHALLADLEIATVRAPLGVAADIDTWEDLQQARRWFDAVDHAAVEYENTDPMPVDRPIRERS